MRQIPILSGLWNYLTVPNFPSSSLAVSETHLALITLRNRGGEFEPRNLGVVRLPDGLVRGSFDELNIADREEMIEQLQKTATQAGMGRVKALSASLPAGSARSIVIALDNLPGSSAEASQMIEWKIERTIGRPYADLRANYVRLKDFEGRPHWLASVASERVISQYEEIFESLGWNVGLIAPQHLGEAQWLIRSGIEDDQVVVSLNDRGFDAVIVRGRDPILVREVECPVEEREDELHRLLVFYRDRLAPFGSSAILNRVLVIGDPAEQRRCKELISSAIETNVISLDPQQLGLKIDPHAPFIHFAAAGGLATMAWN